jgi:multidrug efflux pump subunit AcrA (membrane-fusion protein)
LPLAALPVVVSLACGKPDLGGARVVAAQRQDLVLDVEVTGTLKSLESEQVGPPQSVSGVWEFKILRMIPEGSKVKVGDEVIAFDPSELERKLADYENEVASISEELGKSRSEGALTSADDRLDLEDARAKLRKAEMKADKPADLTAELTLRLSGIERDLADREVAFRRQRDGAKRAQERSTISILTGRLNRARERVTEFKSYIEAMAVKARRAGTVVYKQDWRGEKKKPGDGTWRGETLLEIAALDKMAAEGQVDEVDASKVTVGQRVGLRLEAHPDREYAGLVQEVGSLVRTESPESRVKIAELQCKLLETDPMLMRPGMRFRGRIEIARLPGVLQVPLAALVSNPRGATVNKLAGREPRPTPVTVGRRSREMVEITGGLQPGDRVLLRAPAAASKPGGGMRLGDS